MPRTLSSTKTPSAEGPQFNTSVSHKDHTFSAPKISRFHTKNLSVQHIPTFHTKNSSVPHLPQSTPGQCVELRGFLCGMRDVWNWGVFVWIWESFWTEGFFCVELRFVVSWGFLFVCNRGELLKQRGPIRALDFLSKLAQQKWNVLVCSNLSWKWHHMPPLQWDMGSEKICSKSASKIIWKFFGLWNLSYILLIKDWK